MNGANCGKLCFRNEEFIEIRKCFPEKQGVDYPYHLPIHFVDDSVEDLTT
jgi:hypothetical protein